MKASFSEKDYEDMNEREQEDSKVAHNEPPAVRSWQPGSKGGLEWAVCRAVINRVIGEEGDVVTVVRDEVSEGEETVGSDDATNTNQKEEDEGVDFVVSSEEASGLVSSFHFHCVSRDEASGKQYPSKCCPEVLAEIGRAHV